MLLEHRLRLEAEAQKRGLLPAPPTPLTFDPLPLAFDAQRRFLEDRSAYRVACTTRRAGKTTAYAMDIVRESVEQPSATVVYLNTTRIRAQEIIWEELKRVVEDARLPYKANEQALSLKGPGNRWIRVSGAETKKQIEKWKGRLPAVWAFYIDEAQDWDDEILDHGIARVMIPALADRGGRISVAGTPGPLPEGYFYELTRNEGWSNHFWTLFHNPHVRFARKLIRDSMRLRKVDIKDPTIQREFFGRWVRDTQAMVFGALDDELNSYDVLPDVTDFREGVGLDFGFVDSSAYAGLGYSPQVRGMFVTAAEEWAGVGPTETVELLGRTLGERRHRMVAMVGDPGGGGKGMMSDLWDRFGLAIEVAEKPEKVTACRLMADAIATRELKLRRDMVSLRRALRRVQWDPDHRGQKLKGHTPDVVDALLYIFRKLWPMYRHVPPAPAQTRDEYLRQRDIERRREEAELERELI